MTTLKKIVLDLENIIGKELICINEKNKYISCSLENDEKILKIANFVKEKRGRTITVSVIEDSDKYKLNYIFNLENTIILNIQIEIKNKSIKSISSALKCSLFFQNEINKKHKIRFIENNNIKILEKRIGNFSTVTNTLDDIATFKYEVKNEIVKNVEISLSKSISMPLKNVNELNSFYSNSTNNNSLVYSLAIENIANIEISKKVKLIRMIGDELIRASSHLFNFSILTHFLGSKSLMLKALELKESLQDMKELLWGSRLDCSLNIIGGVRYDISEIKRAKSLEKIDSFIKEFECFYKTINNDEKLNKIIDFAKINKNDVLKYGLVGPIARASYVNQDVRSIEPYLLYSELGFQIKLNDSEDAYSRMLVRLDEVSESIRITRLCLENLPNKSIKQIKNFEIPKGESSIRIEAARGELFYYLRSEGSNKISRIITRTPTIMNWQMLKEVIPNNDIKQMPLFLNSIDPCVSCSFDL